MERFVNFKWLWTNSSLSQVDKKYDLRFYILSPHSTGLSENSPQYREGFLYLAYLPVSWTIVTGSHTGQSHLERKWLVVSPLFLSAWPHQISSSYQVWDMSRTCEPSRNAAHTTVCIPKINFSNSMCIRIIWGPLWKCSSLGSTLGHSNTAGLG